MSKSHSKAWKARERDVAGFHGLVRNPLSGENSGRVGDAYDPNGTIPWVFIEVKLREAHSVVTTLRGLMKQVMKKHGHDALSILALAENRSHGFYIMVHSSRMIEYAVKLLETRGYTVTFNDREEPTDAPSHPE